MILYCHLYVARGDAYLKSGDGHKASTEYARAIHNYPQYQLKPDEQSVYDNPNFTPYQP